MKVRRINLNPDEILLVRFHNNEVLSVQPVVGSKGNTQVFANSRPAAKVNLDAPQWAIPGILADDLLPNDDLSS